MRPKPNSPNADLSLGGTTSQVDRFRRVKRVIDVVGSGVGLVVSAVPMAVISIAVRQKLGSPVFFRQVRPGLNGEPFEMVKFRTMTDKRDVEGRLLPDRERLTAFGLWLRSTSLDELPELFNVLKGDMSLVGPRPLLMRYMPYFTAEERIRFSVRPGITGLAQVRGRNSMSWQNRLDLDVEYVSSLSLANDLNIIAETIMKVIRRADFSSDPSGEMDDFDVERMRLKAESHGD